MNIESALVGFVIGALTGAILTWKLRGHISDTENRLKAHVATEVAVVKLDVANTVAEVKAKV